MEQTSFFEGYNYEPAPKDSKSKYKKPFELYGYGPPGTKCETCKHMLRIRYHNRRYLKCESWILSHSTATDIRAQWASCGKYENGNQKTYDLG